LTLAAANVQEVLHDIASHVVQPRARIVLGQGLVPVVVAPGELHLAKSNGSAVAQASKR
jgi:hypothetical protein